MVPFFALIGMVVEEEKIREVAKAIEELGRKKFGEVYIISFGENPEIVYSVMKGELTSPMGDKISWQ
jgi:hypothetical protein